MWYRMRKTNSSYLTGSTSLPPLLLTYNFPLFSTNLHGLNRPGDSSRLVHPISCTTHTHALGLNVPLLINRTTMTRLATNNFLLLLNQGAAVAESAEQAVGNGVAFDVILVADLAATNEVESMLSQLLQVREEGWRGTKMKGGKGGERTPILHRSKLEHLPT